MNSKILDLEVGQNEDEEQLLKVVIENEEDGIDVANKDEAHIEYSTEER